MYANYNIMDTLARLACLNKVRTFGLPLQSLIIDNFNCRDSEFVSDFSQACNLQNGW